MAEVQKPSDLPKAKKHKVMNSDEEDEEPQNEPGTSSNSQPCVCTYTTMPCVQRSLCLDAVTNDSGSTKVEVPRGVETCWYTVLPPVEKQQEQRPR